MLRSARSRRTVAAAILALLLLPLSWLRSDRPDGDRREGLVVQRIEAQRPAPWPAQLQLQGVWQLNSQDALFGSYSALVALPGGRLRAYSDRGPLLEFAMPPGPPGQVRFAEVINDPNHIESVQDIEAAYRDAESGDVWLALESPHSVRRFAPGGAPLIRVERPETREWPANGGAEAMVRLGDGRFVLLGENLLGHLPGSGPGLLFDGDPTEGAAAMEFSLRLPDGLYPTDMALLPDGRALILLRGMAFGIPPFRSALAIADPASIREGEAWQWTLLAELGMPLPQDNYEGMAIIEEPDDSVTIWLISDDNGAMLQRTLLVALQLELDWPGQQETRGNLPARSE